MAENCGSRSTDLCSRSENNRIFEKRHKEQQSSSKSALSCTSDEEDDDDSQLDGMSFDSNDRELAEKMMLEKGLKDAYNYREPDASDILASLHSPSTNVSPGEAMNKVSEAALKKDKEEDRAQKSSLINTDVEKSSLESFGRTNSLFHRPLFPPTHEHDDALDMERTITDDNTTKEDESAKSAKIIPINIDGNGDIITEHSRTYPLNSLEMRYKDGMTCKMMARASALINNSTLLFNSSPTNVSDVIRLKPHQNSWSTEEAVPPCNTGKITAANGSTMITSTNAFPNDPGPFSQDNKFATLNIATRKRPYGSISGGFTVDSTDIHLTDEIDSLHTRKNSATTTGFAREQSQNATAETLIPHYNNVEHCAKSSQRQSSYTETKISRRNQPDEKKAAEKRLFQDNVKDYSTLSQASRVDKNSSFSKANDVPQLDQKETAKANTLLSSNSFPAAKNTVILPTCSDFGGVDHIQQQSCSSNVPLPLLNGNGTNHVKHVVSSHRKPGRQRNDTVLDAVSKVACRAKLLLPMTRSTDVPNAKINLMCPQQRPRLYNNNEPPLTLSIEIDPQKKWYRINNMPALHKEHYVTCYDRKTCKVLENVCESGQLAELLAGHAELEPVILPINDECLLKRTHNNGSCSQSSFSREGRSSSNIRVLSALRPQNSLLRCSDSHIGKVVQVIDGIYSGRKGTITSTLPAGWYTLSGLVEEEDTDIYIKASNVTLCTDSADDLSSLQGLDTSLLQQLLHRE